MEIRLAPFRPFSWWSASTRAVEALSAFAAWGWVMALALPGSVVGNRPAFQVLASIASFASDPEAAWVIVFATIGVLQSTGACFDVMAVRCPGAILATLAWSMVATSFAIAFPDSPTIGTYLSLAAFNAWVVARGPSVNGRRR